MLDLMDRGHKLGLRILEMYGGRLKIRMCCQIHAFVNRDAQHRPWVPAIKAFYVGAAAEEAKAKRGLRRDHRFASRVGTAPLDARMTSAASRKSLTSRSGASRASQSRQPWPVLTPIAAIPIRRAAITSRRLSPIPYEPDNEIFQSWTACSNIPVFGLRQAQSTFSSGISPANPLSGWWGQK